ncbi:MAG TPA: transketolase [Thermoanaerobaculia bacterium]|nr:transketolase [Thermoanaerobaculia bacterium]
MTDLDRRADDLDRLAIDTVRFLAVDMVEAANSGHPGAPLGQAAMGYWLWTRHMRHNPSDPRWPNRDRFVLSCGHASALLYALLHLAGYQLSMNELKRFRQFGSHTPGHPEHEPDFGIETTTGPLGQGIGNAVGMAIAERMLAARFNRDGFPVFDHRVWVHASDGDLMEGIASEASSLAGHLRLGKLNVLYDDNEISIDGPTDLSFREDVAKRYEAYGWHVHRVENGSDDLAALDAAMQAAREETDRPSLLVVRTHIGYGSPKQDSADAHGSPLGPEATKETKRNLGWPEDATFHVPDGAQDRFAQAAHQGARAQLEWEAMAARYAAAHPEAAAELAERRAGKLPAGWTDHLPSFPGDGDPLATRKASGKVLGAVAPQLPMLVGGSADLTPSNNTNTDAYSDFSADNPSGRYLRFGVREHAMGSIMNGIALSGLLIPYGGTFLIFSDYMKPPIRLAALMKQRAIYVFTHDSIFLGEDGPTHQPVAQLASLRAVPNLLVFRPADGNETAAAWKIAIENRTGPSALALTRQGLPPIPAAAERAADGVPRGAYVLADCDGEPDLLLLATGSEVWVCMEVQKRLAADGVACRVVSMPCWELFGAQTADYRDEVIPPSVSLRLGVEAGASLGWHRWVGPAGDVIAVDRFGASAPWKDVAKAYGFTVDAVEERARGLLG